MDGWLLVWLWCVDAYVCSFVFVLFIRSKVCVYYVNIAASVLNVNLNSKPRHTAPPLIEHTRYINALNCLSFFCFIFFFHMHYFLVFYLRLVLLR